MSSGGIEEGDCGRRPTKVRVGGIDVSVLLVVVVEREWSRAERILGGTVVWVWCGMV